MAVSWLQKQRNPDEEVRFVLDLMTLDAKYSQCPRKGSSGNHAYNQKDNFKLMILSSGKACDWMAETSPPGTEEYCLSQQEKAFGGPVRGWAVAVDLRHAKPIVRNPSLEKGGGKSQNNLPTDILDMDANTAKYKWLQHKFELGTKMREVLAPGSPYEEVCRYVAYSPSQFIKNAPKQIRKARVVMNSNFYLFLDVRDMPCGTPIGPTVSQGQIIQTYKGSRTNKKVFIREKIKMTDTLVMHDVVGAFIMDSKAFDTWFEQLNKMQQSEISAITGMRILKDGHSVDHLPNFTRVGSEAFVNGKNARSAIGIQYDGFCKPPAPTSLKCGNMLILLQFEKSSQGNTVVTFFDDKPIKDKHRPPSAGVNLPELQDIVQYMMLDDVLNFDGSGSSSFWTNIGDLEEKRSQPSDITRNGGYQFRPSPILIGFADRS